MSEQARCRPTGNPGRCSPVYPGRKPISRFCAAFAITLNEHGVEPNGGSGCAYAPPACHVS
jgi:hypothetical protein